MKPENECSTVFDELELPRKSVSKVLGLIWDKSDDTLSCEISEPEGSEIITKRVILSYINQVFDPVGFLSPALLPLKLILQNAWTVKLGWDDELPTEALTVYRQWLSGVQHLRSINVSRNMTGGLCPSKSSYELHTFCDASKDAYAAVVYLRTVTVNNDDNINV